MRILFISNYFPPEVNAPATRVYEHAKQWVADGHEVEVLTSCPNFPEGEVYDGYENHLAVERVDGITVTRVPMYVTPNKGIVRRTLSYISFMAFARWYADRLQNEPDVLVATSPQFFAAIAGYWLARLKQVPFVLEIRDLWPESVVAVGAMERNIIIRSFERVEKFLYREADHIVPVTNAFKRSIVAKGIDPGKVTVIENGVEPETWNESLDRSELERLRHKYELRDKFVVSYIGTIGMAHRVEVMLEAAERCSDPNVVFMVVGAGAEREKLERRQAELQLPNFRLVDKVPKDQVPYLLELTDASVVHLRDSPLFETVIPSKIFEAMATRTPIILGVKGETEEIIRKANAGIPIEPENPDELARAALQLKSQPQLCRRMGANGYEHVYTHFDRRTLARRYASLLAQTCGEEEAVDTRERQLTEVQ